STDDPRFTREFDESGHAVDRYAGDDNALIPGDWNLFAGGDPPAGLPHAGLEPNAVYIVLRQRGDVLLFGLTRADEAALQMVYLGRGNTLNFSRLK
ncbi:MAG: hypothetical protein KGL26_09700, partial [Pseudomonadota bacterium]|nr:hypothetical protein [Pseudomonadota bacterium]